MRTRKPRSVGRQENRADIFGITQEEAPSKATALFSRERIIRADTAHCVSGYAPFGGAAQFKH